MSEAIDYKYLSEKEFWEMLEEGYCHQDSQFYEEFKRRAAEGRHYNPNTDPQAWEKSNAAMIAFMNRVGLPHSP
jgi:murein L,D-transpeptidase YafK